MERRHFLAAGAAGCVGGLAGCSAVERLGIGSDGRHPFAGATLGVRIDDRGTTAHDVGALTTEVLDYWAAESSQYAGFEVDFERVGEDADILLAYVDTSEDCSAVEDYSSDVLGCAPLLGPRNRVSRPVTAYVVAADRPFGSVRTTAKHELGHILGLGHDDEPREIMSNRPEDRILRYEIRIEIWETVLDGYEQTGNANQRLSNGIDAWNSEQYTDAVDAFAAAETGFAEARRAYATALNRTRDLDADPPLETVNLASLQAEIELLGDRAATAGEVAQLMAEASRAERNGDRSTAQKQASDAGDRLAAFRDLESPEVRTVAVTLGLVRGFDREDEGVAVEGDGL